jgi:hypothetical protein
MSEPKVLLSGLGIPESPQWHGGRLWFCNWIDRQVVTVGLDGSKEVASVTCPVRASDSVALPLLGEALRRCEVRAACPG